VGGTNVIGVDVGGTKILAGLVRRDGTVERDVEHHTPIESEEAILGGIAGAIEELIGGEPAAIGLGVPCNLDPATGIAYRATNIPLTGVDLRGWAVQRFGIPVGVENDGNAAALAEFRLGAGRDVASLVALTLGTGVGGGIVLDGTLYRGWAELGHVVVEFDGPPCQGNCHGRGHVESVASGHAATRVAQELYGGDADAHTLVERAKAGKREAIEALDRIGRLLGAAIGSFANIFDPDLFVVGGGFGAAAGELLLGPAQESARREAIQPADVELEVVPAALGERAGLIGAALVGFEAVDGVR
jgi:glucokinase